MRFGSGRIPRSLIWSSVQPPTSVATGTDGALATSSDAALSLVDDRSAFAAKSSLNAQASLAVLRETALRTRPPGLDAASYARGHAQFEARSDQRSMIVNWLRSRANARLTASGAPADSPMSVLSIGCGDGAVDVEVAEQLTRSTRQVRYVGVEPFQGSADRFVTTMRDLDRTNLDVEVRNTTFADSGFGTGAVAGDTAVERFDLVAFVHSMYYVPDVAAAVRAAHDLLRPGGELLILSAPVAALNKVVEAVAPNVEGHPQWFSDDVRAGLGDAGLVVAEQGTLDACVDLTDASEEALDFTVQARLTPLLRRMVLTHLDHISLSEGALLIPHPVDTYRVTRGIS